MRRNCLSVAAGWPPSGASLPGNRRRSDVANNLVARDVVVSPCRWYLSRCRNTRRGMMLVSAAAVRLLRARKVVPDSFCRWRSHGEDLQQRQRRPLL
jgi:hypothetical protein